MNRKELVDEITQFCIVYKVFDKIVNVEEIKGNIEFMLDDCTFIENLFNIIIRRAQRHNNSFDIERIKTMFLELEKTRLNLEYNDIKKI